MNAKIARFEEHYRDIQSGFDCAAPANAAQKLLCASAQEQRPLLWRMSRLNDLAWVYAYENATGKEVDPSNPPADAAFIAARDACTDAQCLCTLFVERTNDSLGGESPYRGG